MYHNNFLCHTPVPKLLKLSLLFFHFIEKHEKGVSLLKHCECVFLPHIVCVSLSSLHVVFAAPCI